MKQEIQRSGQRQCLPGGFGTYNLNNDIFSRLINANETSVSLLPGEGNLFLACTVTQYKNKSKTIEWMKSRNWDAIGDW